MSTEAFRCGYRVKCADLGVDTKQTWNNFGKALQANQDYYESQLTGSPHNRVPSVVDQTGSARYYDPVGSIDPYKGPDRGVVGELGEIAEGIGGAVAQGGMDLWNGLVDLGGKISDTADNAARDALTALRGTGNAAYNFISSRAT